MRPVHGPCGCSVRLSGQSDDDTALHALNGLVVSCDDGVIVANGKTWDDLSHGMLRDAVAAPSLFEGEMIGILRAGAAEQERRRPCSEGDVSDLPAFHTGRLVVRPRVMADLHACLAMDRDPEVTRFVAGPWDDPARHEAFVRERIATDFGRGLGYWSVFDRHEPHCFLGWILLVPCDGNGPDIEIGWRFVRRAWGRGYATEAALPVVAHAFGTLGLGRIVAGIAPGNEGSMNVARKIGMRRSGPSAGAETETEAEVEALFVMTRADHEVF